MPGRRSKSYCKNKETHFFLVHLKDFIDKRAHRALGCTPEEKVNGHSGAIYRGPLMLYTKYQGSSRFLQEDFQDFLYFSI